MGLGGTLNKFKESKEYKNLKGTAMLKLFGLTKIPLLFLVNPKVRELSESRCVVEIPLSKMTKNHHGSMYFGVLAIGADCAAGLFATYKSEQVKGYKFSLIFKDFKANFLKRAESNVHFVCTDVQRVDEVLREAIEKGERVTRSVRVEARLPKNNDELVAEFELGLSLKPQKV